MELTVLFKFCAAHRLPFYDGPCNRTHGHNYRFEVSLEGEPDPSSGMLLDFVEIDHAVQRLVIAKVDHQNLNDFLENPTAELIVRWFWELLEGTIPGLSSIRLWEVDSCSVVYRGPPAARATIAEGSVDGEAKP